MKRKTFRIFTVLATVLFAGISQQSCAMDETIMKFNERDYMEAVGRLSKSSGMPYFGDVKNKADAHRRIRQEEYHYRQFKDDIKTKTKESDQFVHKNKWRLAFEEEVGTGRLTKQEYDRMRYTDQIFLLTVLDHEWRSRDKTCLKKLQAAGKLQ